MKTQIRLTKASLNGIDVAPISLELATELCYTAVLADAKNLPLLILFSLLARYGCCFERTRAYS